VELKMPITFTEIEKPVRLDRKHMPSILSLQPVLIFPFTASSNITLVNEEVFLGDDIPGQ
jgi:hypothetical protein